MTRVLSYVFLIGCFSSYTSTSDLFLSSINKPSNICLFVFFSFLCLSQKIVKEACGGEREPPQHRDHYPIKVSGSTATDVEVCHRNSWSDVFVTYEVQ